MKVDVVVAGGGMVGSAAAAAIVPPANEVPLQLLTREKTAL